MKILQVGSALFSSGGIEKTILRISEGMRVLGHEVHITAPPDTWVWRSAQERGFTTIPIAIRHQHDFRALGPYKQLLRREYYHIINTHFSPDYLIPALAARLERQSGMVMTRHLCRPWRGFKRWLYGEALYHRIIAVSEAVRRALLSGGMREGQVATVHVGVDLPACAGDHASLRAELNLPPNAVLIGILSRISPEKGHRFLLEAMRSVDGGAYCLVVGDGKDAPVMQAYTQANGLAERVRFLGWRQDSDAILTALDIVVQPSVWEEACSGAIIEAMSQGKPLVATRVGGNPELVEHGLNGLIVPKEDAGALAGALNTLIRDTELRQGMGKAGLKRQRERFSVRTMTENMERVYAELLRLP